MTKHNTMHEVVCNDFSATKSDKCNFAIIEKRYYKFHDCI